ncbi:MAG: hydrogenase 4 subunit F [Acidithiobacillus sp.]|nr:hydrogenase 4 subunit F [Acidithiobacillus sp.]
MIIFWVLVLAGAGVPLLAFLGSGRRGARLFLLLNFLVLIACVVMSVQVATQGIIRAGGDEFRVDAFSLLLALVNSTVGFSIAWFSHSYFLKEVQHHGLSAGQQKLYHSMFQLFLFTMLLAVLTNNMGILWVALEGATLSSVLLVSLMRKPQGLEAAWKYFILCGVGLAMALLGTVLLYFAAEPALGAGSDALLWSQLHAHSAALNSGVLTIAFIFVLVGFGTKVGLAPLHSWLPDAHAAGPSSASAALSALLLNVALYAILRFKSLLSGPVAGPFAAHLLMGFGLLTLLLAAFSMFRQQDVKRLFAYSSMEHMALITFAFGLGGPLAVFAGMLHMLGHSLAKSSVFFATGQASQEAGTQDISALNGLLHSRPVLGWSVLLSVLAILGMPPGSLFFSEILILASAVQQSWQSVPFLLVGLGTVFAAIYPRLQAMLLAPANSLPNRQSGVGGLLPVFFQISLVVILGVAIPGQIELWLHDVAGIVQ